MGLDARMVRTESIVDVETGLEEGVSGGGVGNTNWAGIEKSGFQISSDYFRPQTPYMFIPCVGRAGVKTQLHWMNHCQFPNPASLWNHLDPLSKNLQDTYRHPSRHEAMDC